MPKQTAQQKKALEDFFSALAASGDFMAALASGTLGDKELAQIQLAGQGAQLALVPRDAKDFLRLLTHHPMVAPATLSTAVAHYKYQHKSITNSHRQQKRSLAEALGLKKDPCSCKELQAQGVHIIYCSQSDDTPFKCGTTLVDQGNEGLVKGCEPILAVPADDTWYVVPPGASVIFLGAEGKVELVVLRHCCAAWPNLIDYVNEVIAKAVEDCHNCCPNHGGTLVQYGWNAGPCHARIFGLECAECDRKILGVFALSWNLLTAALPKEVIEPTLAAIAAADLPVMASQGNVQDTRYQLQLPGGPLTFNTAERAPAEGTIHTDKLFAPYALNWVTQHEVKDGQVNPQLTGGNYVDVSLRVVVKCATDTIMTMCPKFKHGTTVSCPGVLRQGTAINFSTHIKVAYAKAAEKEGFDLKTFQGPVA
ncbi:hypothetical protein V8B97DRAFT_1883409 [Scleroderma yunnanense]